MWTNLPTYLLSQYIALAVVKTTYDPSNPGHEVFNTITMQFHFEWNGQVNRARRNQILWWIVGRPDILCPHGALELDLNLAALSIYIYLKMVNKPIGDQHVYEGNRAVFEFLRLEFLNLT